jgi:hypothetical protein
MWSVPVCNLIWITVPRGVKNPPEAVFRAGRRDIKCLLYEMFLQPNPIISAIGFKTPHRQKLDMEGGN